MRRKLPTVDASCVCLPELGYTCKNCSLQSDPVAVESKLKAQGYGYERSDNDGYDGGEVSATDDKRERDFLEAASEMFEATEL